MTPADIRERADDLASDGYDESAAIMRALADVVEAALEEHRDFGLRPPCAQALARVEALKP